jgi:LmbE family N-acetylglucosaminyl deacetylase
MKMVTIAHPDDEAVCFGGLLPYLTRILKESIILVVMCCLPGSIRANEIEEACEVYGPNIEIEYGGFCDRNMRYIIDSKCHFLIKENFEVWGGRDNVVGYLESIIRKYSPSEIYTHDLGGEGYHSNHICTSQATKIAYDNCKSIVKKLNIHLYKENSFIFNWDQKVDNMTLYQWANKGLQHHISQHCPAIRSDSSFFGFRV